jgi:hypothetical protein
LEPPADPAGVDSRTLPVPVQPGPADPGQVPG